MNPYTIRQATEADAESIAFVHVNSWQTSYAGIIDQSFLDTISYEKRLVSWKEILASKRMLHLVGVHEDQIVGFVGIGPIRPEFRVAHHPLFQENVKSIGEVYAIYLLEHHKGKGL